MQSEMVITRSSRGLHDFARFGQKISIFGELESVDLTLFVQI